MFMPVPNRAPALFRAGDLGVSAEWRDISYDWSPLLTPDGVAIYSYLRDTYDQQRSLYPFLLIPEGPTKKKIQTRLGLKSAYAMHGPEFLLTTVGLLHVDVVYGQGADPERPHHTHVAYYVVGRLDHPVLDWPMLERILDALLIALAPAAADKAALSYQKKAEAALRSLGQAGLLQNCDPRDLFYELGAWPNLLPTLVGDQRWAALFTYLHGREATERYRRLARIWAEYAQRYVTRLEQDNQAIRDQVLAAQRGGPRRRDTASIGGASERHQPGIAALPASSQIAVTPPHEVTAPGSVTTESLVSHQPHEVTLRASVTPRGTRSGGVQRTESARDPAESLARDQLTFDRCRREKSFSPSDSVPGVSLSDTSADETLPGDLPLIEPHLRDAELGSSRFDAYFWCAVNDILHGSSERYPFSPGEKQAVFRQFKRQNVPVGVVLAALRASKGQLLPDQRQTLADVLKTPLFHACVQRALALLPTRTASSDDQHSWPAFLAAYRRVGFAHGLRDVSVPDYNVLQGLFMQQPAECWEVLSRIEHMAEAPDLSPRYLQRAIVNNQRAAAEGAQAQPAQTAICRPHMRDVNEAVGSKNNERGRAAPDDPRRALLEQEGLKPQLLTEGMTEAFITAWIAEADARQQEIKSRTRWLVWGLTSGALPADHPTLPPRAAAPQHVTHGWSQGASGSRAETFVQGAGSPAQLWQIARARLVAHVEDTAFRMWFDGVELHAIAPTTNDSRSAVAYLVGDHHQSGRLAVCGWEDVQATYGTVIEQTISEVCGYPVLVVYAETPDDLPPGVWATHGAAASDIASSGQQLWTRVLADLKRRLARDEFETWLTETRLIALEADQAIVGTSNIFVREKIEGTYVGVMAEALRSASGRPIDVQVVIDSFA